MLKNNLIRILQVVGTMDFGGAETLIMNIYRRIDRSKVQFDFLCHNRMEGKYTDEILQLGGRIYQVDGIKKAGLFDYCKQLKVFFETHPEYKVVHAHNTLDNGIVLWQAKKAKIPCRISHSHNTKARYNTKSPLIKIYQVFSKCLNSRAQTHRFACSKEAGVSLFGKKDVKLLYNAIDINTFRYDEEKRRKIRTKYCIDKDEILFGHIGRFAVEKNHSFLLQMFAEYRRQYKKGRLMLVGGGPLEYDIRNMAEQLGIDQYIIFVGLVSNTYEYYAAMDVFLFPSISEGLPVSLVEAQTSGLPIVMSDTISSQTIITDRITQVSLDKPAEYWIEVINQSMEKIVQREYYADIVEKTSFNIENCVGELQDMYLMLYNR